jgi:hypothetical protein
VQGYRLDESMQARQRFRCFFKSGWSGAGSNRRPSAFQVNRAKRCADLQKRTSPTSETALGGRCKVHASRGRHALSIRRDRRLPLSDVPRRGNGGRHSPNKRSIAVRSRELSASSRHRANPTGAASISDCALSVSSLLAISSTGADKECAIPITWCAT